MGRKPGFLSPKFRILEFGEGRSWSFLEFQAVINFIKTNS